MKTHISYNDTQVQEIIYNNIVDTIKYTADYKKISTYVETSVGPAKFLLKLQVLGVIKNK